MSSNEMPSDLNLQITSSPLNLASSIASSSNEEEEDAEKREHYESMVRIKQERAREQRELLKYMCDMPNANKFVAARAAAQIGEDTILEECARSPSFSLEARSVIGLGDSDDLQIGLGSMNSFRKAEYIRNKEMAAKAVLSMDELFSSPQELELSVRRPSSSLASSFTPATPSRSTSSLSFHRISASTSPTNRSQASSHLSHGPEDEEMESFLCPRTIQYFGAPNSWQRRWSQAPAAPQQIRNRNQLPESSSGGTSSVFGSPLCGNCSALTQKSANQAQIERTGSGAGSNLPQDPKKEQSSTGLKPFERSQSSITLLSQRLIGGRKMGERRLNLSYETQPSLPSVSYMGYIASRNSGSSNRMAKSANT